MTAISGTGLHDIATSAQSHPATCHIIAPRRYVKHPSGLEDFQGTDIVPENFHVSVVS